MQASSPRVPIPRYPITYEVKTEAGLENRELPFVIGVLADLGGHRTPERRFHERTFVDIDLDSFDELLAARNPGLAFKIDSDQGGAPLAVELRFRSMADFDPEGVARQISHASSRQLEAVLGAPEFQGLEAAWRGLHYLVCRVDPETAVKVRVMSASRRELSHDLERAARFDQSFFFKCVHDDVYGVRGVEPFDILIGDYGFGHGDADVALLRGISQVAAAIHAPFIAAASPRMFGCGSFDDLPPCGRTRNVLQDAEHEAWRSFRSSETAKYAILTLPRFLLGPPQADARTGATDCSRSLWGNAAYVLAVKMAESYRRYGLPVAMRGVEHGFERLPIHALAGAGGGTLRCGPTEAPIEDTEHHTLTLGGFAALCGVRDLGGAVFFTVPTCGLPLQGPNDSPRRRAEASMRTQLSWVMAGSRFAHYVKVIVRETNGSLSPRECGVLLNRWLAKYVAENGEYRPLKQAGIEVSQDRAGTGICTAMLWLEPQFPWLDDESVVLHLAVPLPLTFEQG